MSDNLALPPLKPVTTLTPPSPTGTPVLSQTFVRWIAPVVAILALVGFAPDTLKEAGLDMPALPAAALTVISVCKALSVLLGGFFGIRSQGKRVGTVVPVLLLCFALSCAPTSPLIITGDSLDAAAITFEATAAGLASANASQSLTPEQVQAWNSFRPKFQASYRLAVALWRAAQANGDKPTEQQAAAILAALLSQLQTFTQILVGSLDGGK